MHRPYSAYRTFLLQWLPVVLWAGLIFAFSAQSNLRFAQTDAVDLVVRKAGHMFVFGVLAILLWRALTSALIDRAVVWSWLIAAAYAGTDEFHQSFTTGTPPVSGRRGDRRRRRPDRAVRPRRVDASQGQGPRGRLGLFGYRQPQDIEAAVHVDRLARRLAREIAGQVDGRSGHILDGDV